MRKTLKILLIALTFIVFGCNEESVNPELFNSDVNDDFFFGKWKYVDTHAIYIEEFTQNYEKITSNIALDNTGDTIGIYTRTYMYEITQQENENVGKYYQIHTYNNTGSVNWYNHLVIIDKNHYQLYDPKCGDCTLENGIIWTRH